MTNNHCVHKPELNSFGVKRCLFQAANQPNFSPQLLYWRLHLYSLFIVLKCKCTSWCSNPKQPAVLDTWDVDQQRAFCGWQVPVALLLGYMGCRWLGHHPHPHRLHPPLRRLDSVLSTTFSQLEREIRFGCSGEIQLFTGTNPVTELVATKAREERHLVEQRQWATSRLWLWQSTGDNMLNDHALLCFWQSSSSEHD